MRSGCEAYIDKSSRYRIKPYLFLCILEPRQRRRSSLGTGYEISYIEKEIYLPSYDKGRVVISSRQENRRGESGG